MKKANLLYITLQIALWGIYGVLYSYANRYLLSLGLNSSLTGAILAIATAVAFFMQPLLTGIIDKAFISLKGVLVCIGGLMLICCAVLPFIQNAIIASVIYAIAYVGVVVYPAFINSIGVVAMKSGFNVNFALARGVGAFAFGVVAQGTNIIISNLGVEFVPVFSIVFCLTGIAATLVFPKGTDIITKKEKASSAVEFFRRNKKFALMLISIALLNIGHNILGNCMYQISVFKGDGNAQGTVLMISTFVEIPTIVFFVKMLRFKGSGYWLKLSGVFFTLRIILSLILPGIAGLIIAQSCQILGYALYTVCSVYYAGEVVSTKDTVKGQTYITTANTVGCLIAHLCGGMMIDMFGVGNMLIITALISAVGMISLFFTTKNTPRISKSSN